MVSARPLTRRRIAALAWPIILANASVPLLGLADTAVIGRYASLEDLGAVAIGAVIFSFVYWGFGFLRMGTTGFTAQASGAGDEPEVRAALFRALGIAVIIGLLLILFQAPIGMVALSLMGGSETVSAIASDYFSVRIWGAPAALGLFAIMGLLIGLGKSRTLLFLQLFLNGLNILLDIWFAGVLGMGASGIALGTAIAEWCSVLLGIFLVWQLLRERQGADAGFVPWQHLRDMAALRRTLAANTDIMIRTLLLVFSFAWFVRQSGQFGDDVLAANHILLQLISFSAFFLDGFAFVAEAVSGEAAGAGDRGRFDTAVRLSSELAGISALVLAVLILLLGELAVAALTTHEAVRVAAATVLELSALYVALSFIAFQLDGVFIGTTRTRQMRNAAVLSTGLFLLMCWWLVPLAGNHGLWWAFIVYVLGRALALAFYYPGLRASITHSASSRR